MSTKINLSKNRFTTYEFTVPDYYLCALILGDYSGLSDDEESEIQAFIDDVVKKYGYANFVYNECDSYFSHKNDINGLAGDVTTISLMIKNPNFNV